ncbi:MAG: ADP-glyceromanno-heptose 6-epimerase [Candidatus Omnitrophota bacterium]
MIVITGAAGFIGSCILSELNRIGREDIIAVDHLDDSLKEENLKNKKFIAYQDKKDFLSFVRNNQLNQAVETIIHMGACSSTTLQDERYFEENNVEYSKHLAHWCFENKKRFIYASSAATYGDGALGYDDDESMLPQLKPLNLYGLSKQKFDCWILESGYFDRCVGLKFFNVYGPNEYHKEDMRSVIAKAYQVVKEKGKMDLFKSYEDEYAHGEQKRDFIYVKDAVKVVMFFYKNPCINGIFNVGTGKARTWNDLARALFKALKKKPVIHYIDMPEDLRPRYQYFTQANMKKLRLAGYREPFTELEQGVSDYVPYLEKHAYL